MPVPATARTVPDPSPFLIEDADPGRLQSQNLLRTTPNWPFFLAHHPGNWELASEGLEQPMWLPEIQQIPVAPGVCVVRTLRQGEGSEEAYRQQHEWLRQRGFVVIPQDAIVDGEQGYLKRTRCETPRTKREGVFYFDRFAVPRQPMAGKKVKLGRDVAAFNRWRLRLVTHGWVTPAGLQGRIAPPSEDLIRHKVGLVVNASLRKEAKTDVNDLVYERVVADQRKALEVASGAGIPTFQGYATTPTASESAMAKVLVNALVGRVEGGEELEAVLAEVADLDGAIADEVRRRVPAPQTKPAKGGSKK